MAQSPAGKPRKTPKPAAPKKAAGSSASKPSPKAKPASAPEPKAPRAPRKKPAPPPPPAQKKRAPAKKAAGKSPSPALADTKRKAPAKKPARPATGQGAAQIDSVDNKPQLGLTPKEQTFVDEFMVDMNGTQAAIRAKYSAHTARQIATQLLSKLHIQAAIADARLQQQKRTQVKADDALREIALIALADARELVEGKKGCCRYCWGEGHRFQRTVGEMNKAVEEWKKEGKLPADFDEEGGIGYNPHTPPHPECPDCMGDGRLHVVIKDTRDYSPGAVALYAGIKQTKDGVEVKMHSKVDALEKLFKHLGLYEKDNKQKTDPLAALLQRLASENGNGFKPVKSDPEHPGGDDEPSNGFKPRQDDDDEGDDDGQLA